MKRTTKKILCMLLAVMVCLSFYPITNTFAEDTADSSYIKLELADASQKVKAGDELVLKVIFKANKESLVRLFLDFDTETFTYNKAKTEELNSDIKLNTAFRAKDNRLTFGITTSNLYFEANKETELKVVFDVSETAEPKESGYQFGLKDTTRFMVEGTSQIDLVPPGSLSSPITVNLAAESAKPVSGCGQLESGAEYIWSYGGKIEESGDDLVITPCSEDTMKYAVETVYLDGKAYTDYTAADDGTVTIAKSKVSKSLVVMFGYTGNFKDPANGTLSVSRDGKKLTSGDILHGGDVLDITYEDKEGVYGLDKLELTGITKTDDGYVVTAKNGDPTPEVSATLEQLKNVKVKMGVLNTPAYSPEYSLWVNDELVKDKEKVSQDTESAVTMVKKGDVIKVKPYVLEGRMCIGIVNNITNRAYTGTFVADLYKDNGDGTFSHTVGDEKTVGITIATSELFTFKCEESEHGSISAAAAGELTVDGEKYYPEYYFNDKNIRSENSIYVTAKPDDGYRVSHVGYFYENTGGKTRSGNLSYNIKNEYSLSYPEAGSYTLKAGFVKDEGEIKVSSEDELRKVSELSADGDEMAGVDIILTEDIALTKAWTPIGSYYIPFRGNFDGQGHKITGFSEFKPKNNEGLYGIMDCYGLFGRIDGSEVKNVSVYGDVSMSFKAYCSGLYWGSVVGYAVDSSISGCQSYVDYNAEGSLCGAGIVGSLNQGSITSCVNYGDFTLSNGCLNEYGNLIHNSAAGIADSLRKSTMKNCINYGSMTCTDTAEYEDMDQKGNVIGRYDAPAGTFGGLAGGVSDSTIESSANKGDITGSLIYAGGLSATSNDITIKNCYNTGEIHNTGKYQNKVFRVYAGGLVGKSSEMSGTSSKVEFVNSYSSTKPEADYPGTLRVSDMCDSNAATYDNCYSKTDIDKLSGGLTASMLSSAFKDDSNNLNGGYPMLTWESDEKDTTTHDISFTSDPENAEVQVYSDSDMKSKVAAASGETGKYSLTRGTYFYRVSCDGYLAKTGSFKVGNKDKTIEVSLDEAVRVTFDVDPEKTRVTLTDGTGTEVAHIDGHVNTYRVAKGMTYKYSAYPEGYNGISGSFTALKDRTIRVKLTESAGDAKTVNGGDRITEGGTYRLADGATGTVTIDTTDAENKAVTIVGTGIGEKNMYKNIYIDCAAGTDLTMQDVYIHNTSITANMMNFKGKGNKLKFAGVNILDNDGNADGYAMIHVPDSAELTLSGGTLYLYKREQGAGIGGNGGAKGSEGQTAETNGKITIKDARIFGKNSKQGALIGAGANAGTQEPQPITVENSELNLIAISRSAAIGGSAGSGGASKGSDVTIRDSIVNINVDFSGSAIGGGGYDGGNDADGGTLRISGSSIRTFIDTNAMGSWNVDEPGVHDNKAITADIKDGSGDNAVYLAKIDTTIIPDADEYEVRVDGRSVYSGGLHKYAYVNENYYKGGQADIDSTIDNWTELEDPYLYIYMTGEKHDVTVNGYTVNVGWNPLTKKLKVDTAEDMVKTLFDDIDVSGDAEKIKEQLDKATAAYSRLSDEQKAEVASAVEAKLKKLEDEKLEKDRKLKESMEKLAEEVNRPDKVVSVKVKKTGYSSVKLIWSRSDQADGYYVYRADKAGGKYTRVGKTTSATLTDKKLKTGKTYYYKVRAYNNYEFEGYDRTSYGKYSSAVKGRPQLAKVKKLSLKTGSGKVTVKWSKVSGASGYKIYRSTKKSGGYKCVKTIKKGSTVKYVNKNLKKGRNYYYKVRAYRTVDGKKVYGAYTSVKKVRVYTYYNY